MTTKSIAKDAKEVAKEIKKDIKNNWSDIKSKLKKHWNKLSPKDLEEIEGSYTQLVKKVQESYDITREEATKKVHDYIETLGLSVEETAQTTQEVLAEKAKQAKEKFETSVRDSIAKIKDTQENVQEDIGDYFKGNPIKSVGIAVLAGLITGKFLV